MLITGESLPCYFVENNHQLLQLSCKSFRGKSTLQDPSPILKRLISTTTMCDLHETALDARNFRTGN